ncbi:MAG: CRISPR-associated helicase Cas3' [Methanobacterium sp.]|jgi:CRISPR-associated endonuclease/helicase Cas3
MSSSFKLKSHPEKPLEVHLTNVANFSQETILNKEITNKELYSKIAFLIGLSHDFAKSTTFFQKYLIDHEKTEKARHGLLSSIFSYYCIKNYLQTNRFEDFWYIAPISWIVVLRHHGNIRNIKGIDGESAKLKDLDVVKKQLADIEENNIEEITKFYGKLDIDILKFCNDFEYVVKNIKKDLRKLTRIKGLDNYFLTLLFYSVLLDADKMDASETPLPQRVEISENSVDRYKKLVFGSAETEMDQIREKSYNELINSLNQLDLTNDRILSINLPTGCGKTLSAFSFSLKLRKKVENELSFLPKIIYSLPFLSIIDQNAEVISNVLRQDSESTELYSNMLLKHHHLSDMSYKTEKELEISANQSQLLTEGWYSEIIVTTFIQFFYSLITNKNRAARKFHNIVNSIIILDEIQSIPHHYWELLNHSLKYLCKEFNCWVILMTATQPLIFEENIEIKSLVNKEQYFKEFNRLSYTFNLQAEDFEDFKEFILNKIISEPDKDIMIVLNTINASQDLYQYIKGRIIEEFHIEEDGVACSDKLQVINISTLIIPKHRLKRIKRIKNDQKKRNIIITTQVIEAGVDISVDLIYRDMAPLDSIVQTAGRCNRSDERGKGSVEVINLKDNKGRNFYSYIYNSVLINATIDVISGNNFIEEREFNIESVPNYYKFVSERGSQDKSTNLISYLEKLEFSCIKSEFKLIENFEKIDVFVEVDDYAKEIWVKYKEISEIEDRFKRKSEFLVIKSEFYSYIVSVDPKKLGNIVLDSEWLGYLNMDDLNRKYDLETGFIKQDKEDVYII